MNASPNRREFLASLAATASLAGARRLEARPAAEHQLRIEPCTLELAPGIAVKTSAYNGQVPGPLLRLREGMPVTIDVTNATAAPDIVHWHGLDTDILNDGATEEGSPLIAPGKTLRYTLTPRPAGTRWYHTHAMAGDNLQLGAYSGQFGFLLVEPRNNPAPWDEEVNLAIHHWGPHFVPMVDALRAQSANRPQVSGSDVGYRHATINGRMLGSGEPIRVRRGQRVLLRLLNASGTENVVLALPGHSFEVIAMDGNPVPHPRSVDVLPLAVGERVDAIVDMRSPGVWILGSTLERERRMGLGIVIEYAGEGGEPVWRDPPDGAPWDYTSFAEADSVEEKEPDKIFPLVFRDIGPQNGSRFDTWTINNRSWPDIEPISVERGKRYRFLFQNGSGDQHPMHLHRHRFELTAVGKKKTRGLLKDVINVMPLETVAVDFTADNPGDSLLHCHQQLHMDYGFMQLVRYVG